MPFPKGQMMNRWRVVIGGMSMNLALGSLYAWSVFVLPLEKEFKWTRAQTSWVFTIAVVTFAATFILAGRIQDKLGPRPCALIGALLVSAGFFLASMTTSLIFLYTVFGLIVGAGNGFGYATLYGTRNLGMNYGLLFTAWGAAGIIGPMVGARVFDAFGGYRYAFYAASLLAVVAFGSLTLAASSRFPAEIAPAQSTQAGRAASH